MRTNIEIDDKLMKEAFRASGAKTKREAVELGLNLDSADGGSAEQRKASIGAAFRLISGAAPQFQTGDLALPGMLNCENALANLHVVNCGI